MRSPCPEHNYAGGPWFRHQELFALCRVRNVSLLGTWRKLIARGGKNSPFCTTTCGFWARVRAKARLRARPVSTPARTGPIAADHACFSASLVRNAPMPLPLIRELAKSLADARLITIPHCGHSTYFECPGIFNRSVLQFARSIGFGG